MPYTAAVEENTKFRTPCRWQVASSAARLAGVVAVVLQRVADRLRHDGVRSEMDHGLACRFRSSSPAHERSIAHVAFEQRHVGHRLAKAGGEVVEDHHRLAALAQLLYRVAADVARTASDQN